MTKYLHGMATTIIVICSLTPLRAQQWKSEIKELILVSQTSQRLPLASEGWPHKEIRDAIKFAADYIGDSAYHVRQKVLEVSHDMAIRTTDSIARQLAVDVLLQPLAREDHELTRTAVSLLTTFMRRDFSPPARDTIRLLIKRRCSDVNQLIKLAGFLELHDLRGDLRTYTLAGHPASTRWAAMLGLSRMGDESAMKDVLRRVERVGLTDEVVYNVFPDLIYTRHPQAIAYLASLLENEEKNCLAADVEREVPIPCAYRILEHLAPVIENFPLQLDEGGDLKTPDYPGALALAREWFSKNPTYVINNEKF